MALSQGVGKNLRDDPGHIIERREIRFLLVFWNVEVVHVESIDCLRSAPGMSLDMRSGDGPDEVKEGGVAKGLLGSFCIHFALLIRRLREREIQPRAANTCYGVVNGLRYVTTVDEVSSNSDTKRIIVSVVLDLDACPLLKLLDDAIFLTFDQYESIRRCR